MLCNRIKYLSNYLGIYSIFQQLAEFQAKEEEEFGAAARANNSLQSSRPSKKESSDTGSDKPKWVPTLAYFLSEWVKVDDIVKISPFMYSGL